jgi:threonine synthase
LFDVEHDFSGIGDVTTLKRTFAKRMADFSVFSPPWQQSGVWRYRELVMPHLPEEDIVSLAEGNVPILHAGRQLCKWVGIDNLWLILEGMTPTGSFKDFGGTVLISVAKAAGIKAVACASTGDTSAMAAAYAAAAGMKCAVILPAGKVTAVQLAQPLVHGATVITLPGDFDECMRVVRELVACHGVYPANSLNPARIEGHQATAFQVAHFFNWNTPSWIALPVGNGSNCSSVGKGMRLLERLGFVSHKSRILGCQSEAACPLAASWQNNNCLSDWINHYKPMKVGETAATAMRIGNPVSAFKVMREINASDGVMKIASEQDLNEAVAVCGKDGIFVCPQTGTALAGIRNAVSSGIIQKTDTVVAVSTATGLKFTESATRHLEKEIIQLDNCNTSAVAKILQM